MIDVTLQEKKTELENILKGYGKVAVAFSAGVDSTYLLTAATQALGTENVLAITGASAFVPKSEIKEAEVFCQIHHIPMKTINADVLSIDGVDQNPTNRCYLCKKHLFGEFLDVAKEYGIYTLLEGSNKDDEGDYRPGMQAIQELGIKSPLREAGLTKTEIRKLSQELELPTADKPSYACLASRFVYGEKLDVNRLSMVEKAETYLHQLGYRQCRVRVHGESGKELARIELLPEDIAKFMEAEKKQEIISEFKGLGFAYVTVDLAGFRSGSMNEILAQ